MSSEQIKIGTENRYELARAYGIVIASKEEDGVIFVQENSRNWISYEKFSKKWTLEYLRQKVTR